MILIKDSRFLKVIQISALSVFVFCLLANIIGGNLSASNLFIMAARFCVDFLLMPFYYYKSKRVNAYMGSDEYKKKSWMKF